MAAGVKIFFDGGCRPPPHGMATAVVIGGREHVECNLGLGTSMAAEWLALLRAMELARALAVPDPVLLGDALAVIAQATGKARCPASCLGYREALRTIEREVGGCRIRYLKRSQNLAGIVLARAGGR